MRIRKLSMTILSFLIMGASLLLYLQIAQAAQISQTIFPAGQTFTTVPLDQLPAALANAVPGETLLVQTGTYNDIDITLIWNSSTLTTIQAETPGDVIITGNSTIRIKDSTNLKLTGFLFDQTTSSSSIVLDHSSNIEVSDNYFYQNGSSPYGFILHIVNGSAENLIHHNTFDGSRAISVVIGSRTLEDVNNTENEIYNNLFYNIPSVRSVYPDRENNGMESIGLGQGDSFSMGPWVHEMKLYTKVYDNLFEKVVGDGSEIITNKTSNNEFYRNTFLNNQSGLTIRLGESTKVKNNYFENTTKGIRVYGYDHEIENNYLVGGQYGIQLPTGDNVTGGTPPVAGAYYQVDHVEIKGNVIINPSNQAFRFGGGYTERYSLLPINTTTVTNQVYLSNTAKDYMIDGSVTVPYDVLSGFSGNESVLKSAANQGNISTIDNGKINYTFMSEQLPPTPESITGTVPFSSNDPLTGTSWRRPVVEGIMDGEGTIESPYLVTTAAHLNNIRDDLSAHYKLAANIDLSEFDYGDGLGWMPLSGSGKFFTGSLDGNGYIISGLSMNRQAGSLGLFGHTEGAILKNIRLEDVNIQNEGSNSQGSDQNGALAGRIMGGTQVINSFATGQVTGRNYVGGLIGRSMNSHIQDSYAAVQVTGLGTHSVGGLVGRVENSTISRGYANGHVEAIAGTSGIGGLVGQITGTVLIESSYWDVEQSNQTISAGGGTGLTTVAMKQKSSYTDWDFDEVWEIEEGGGYPTLR